MISGTTAVAAASRHVSRRAARGRGRHRCAVAALAVMDGGRPGDETIWFLPQSCSVILA